MSGSKKDPFFVGYLSVPEGLKLFLIATVALLLGCFAALALTIGGTQDDPGDGAFRFDWGRQTLIGILEASPYPIVHVTKGTKRIPTGSTVLLSGNGKRGVQSRTTPLDGELVEISGVAIKRGNIEMLQLRGGRNGIKKVAGSVQMPSSKLLGRWRLSGEICDGKCFTGTMRPGRRLSHKACANLCLINGAPPIFVSSAPVNGTRFFLLVNSEGEALDNKFFHHVAQFISLEGTVEKRGNLHLLKADLSSLKRVP